MKAYSKYIHPQITLMDHSCCDVAVRVQVRTRKRAHLIQFPWPENRKKLSQNEQKTKSLYHVGVVHTEEES